MPGHSCLKQENQFGIHELIIVGYVEADNLLALEMTLKSSRQFLTMNAFHHKNDLSPNQQLGCHRNVRVLTQACGSYIQIGAGRENLLRRRAAKTIFTTEE